MLKKESLTDKIYENLREKIISGQFKKNEKINIDQYAKDIGNSKIPVREAIARLIQDGIVFYKTNVGTRVANIDFNDAREIIDILNKLTGQNIVVESLKSHEEINNAIRKYKEIAYKADNRRMEEIINKLCDQLGIWI